MNKTWTPFRHPKHEAKRKDLPQHIKRFFKGQRGLHSKGRNILLSIKDINHLLETIIKRNFSNPSIRG